MTPEAVRRHFEETGALLSGHFKLSSGLHADRYLQCAKVLQHPDRAGALGAAVAALLAPMRPGVVVSPAMGGVIIGHEVGRGLGVRAIFTERADGAFVLRRGFALDQGERVAVIEDVVTTGKSTREVLEVLREAGAVPVACASIVDRRAPGEKTDAVDGVPYRALLSLEIPAWDPAACPLCAQGHRRRRAGLAPPRGEGVSGRAGAPRAAVAVAAAALAAKLALLAFASRSRPEAFVFIDTGTYVRPSLALLAHGTFSPSPDAAPAPEINRTPGYPAILAATRAVLGERPWAPSAVGALFAFGTAVVAGALAARCFGQRAGVAAAAIVSFEPGSFLHALDVLSDTPFTFLLTLGVSSLAGFAAGERRSPAGAGLWLALATLVRPLSYYLLLPAAALVFFASRRDRPARAAAAFLLAPVLLVGGWKVRNLVRAGTFTLSPIASSELLFYRAAPAAARAEGVPLPEMQRRLGNLERWYRSGGGTEREIFGDRRYADLFPETSRLTLVELDARWRRQALEILAAHPLLAAAVAAKGAGLLLLTPPSLVFAGRFGLAPADPALAALYEDQRVAPFLARLAGVAPALFAASVALTLLLAALWTAAARGFWVSRRELPVPVHAALLGTFVYVVAVSAGAESNDDRYRLPLVPIAAVYAARAVAPRESGIIPDA